MLTDKRKRAIKRFAKGLGAAGVAYTLADGSWVIPELLPEWSIPITTAVLLALQKALQRERR